FTIVIFFIVVFCFFFQAEDGIRDRNVTGVQTCALPISCAHRAPPVAHRSANRRRPGRPARRVRRVGLRSASCADAGRPPSGGRRSEERRGGEEGRGGGGGRPGRRRRGELWTR